MTLEQFGFLRVAAAAPVIQLADPIANAQAIGTIARRLNRQQAALILFPELSLTGYSCEDLFFSQSLHSDLRQALENLCNLKLTSAIVVGLPWMTTDGRLLNCACLIAGGRIQGMVPKSMSPNYGEFYEMRWFTSGADVNTEVRDAELGDFRLTRQQLFEVAGARCAIEICEDLWMVEPPGAAHALAGADLILNPSASNELIGKADYRRDLVRMTSAQRICAYLYASSGPTESTKDVVFGGHLIAAENGALITESERFQLEGSELITEFDIQRLQQDRIENRSFGDSPRSDHYTYIATGIKQKKLSKLTRSYPKHPFVPDDGAEFDARASEILNIQATGLARRMTSAHIDTLVLGLSGGLDSTQAFLVALDALTILKLDVSHLKAFTLPGPGTSKLTRGTAHKLAEVTGVPLGEININAAVKQHLSDLSHSPNARDTVFENAQARERTQILFNQANKLGGLVVGTGDLSELALGWCTFNADHMSNYNVNAGVPKTMMSYLVRWYAEHRADKALSKILLRVLDTPISPELLPPAGGKIAQSTEDIIGPYELHDFFLFHFLRNGSEPEKIFHLACLSFGTDYTQKQIKECLQTFFRRFFSQQFKRTTLPPGPKVGRISLSPRGDWRMPDEVSSQRILERIDALTTSPQAKPKKRSTITKRKTQS